MTKKEYNDKVTQMLNDEAIDFEMLMQGYALLDKEVGKNAYLKKKWANGGVTNDCYKVAFDIAIKKRNEIQKVLRNQFTLSDSDIKDNIKGVEVLLTRKNCDELVELLKTRSFTLMS